MQLVFCHRSAQQTLLHLRLIAGVSDTVINVLLRAINYDYGILPQIYEWRQEQWAALGLKAATIDVLMRELADFTHLVAELNLIERHGYQIVTRADALYPVLLSEIATPPPVLYVFGDVTILHQPCVALVGSRRANEYGQKIVGQFVPALVAHGFTLVSGGAVGADAMVHRATLQVGGKTVVVLGSGLLRPYPLEHERLFIEVVERGGLLVSIFPLRTGPRSEHFPIRNRIISGLVGTVVVIQASARSGTSITAHYALEQGRGVCAVPGDMHDPLSVGCHHLIREGATLISSVDELLEEVGVLVHNRLASVDGAVQATIYDNRVSGVTKKEVLVSGNAHVMHPVVMQLSLAHQDIYQRCVTSISIDDLAVQGAMSLSDIAGILFDLQCEGLVGQDHVGRWHHVSSLREG